MSKSALYAANTAQQTVAVDGAINFGNIIRRYGCNVNMSGGSPVLSGTGYYSIDANITFSDTAAGTATIQLYANGAPIPGALAQVTTGAAGAVHSISIAAMVRNTCGCIDNVITAVLTGVSVSVINASVEIEKI